MSGQVKPSSDGNWHLDKKVPIALILAILAQTFAAGVMLSRMDSRIAALELSDQVSHTENRELKASTEAKLNFLFEERTRLVKVETDVGYIKDAVREIKDSVKRP